MPVGGVATYLVALTARTSLRTGACAALGVATADGLYALVAAVGGTRLTHLLAPLMTPLRWASALVLLALAARGAITVVRQYRGRTGAAAATTGTPVSPARAYAALLGITLLNPATVVYFAALVLGSPATTSLTEPEQALFALAAFAASASWQLLLAGGGALLGRALTGGRGRLLTGLASSALIAGLAGHLLMSAG
ncbi:lysine transporter LysE [Streptomyces kanamyceticus]|uniref:Lysine transporter LysE n=2 Tax=Streptomyces kanamyceticus TaxID=1967 RepID=A0A5J6GTU7_STRKN|nr:lysine transporter LysE [Streptomyces kanamyceticus]